MRIDKNTINSMALEIIDDIATVIYEATGDASDSHNQWMMLGEIAGVCDLAREMKKMLDGEEERM